MAVLVWDASALHHPARAERLDVLGDIAKWHDNVTTAAVVEELDRYGFSDQVERCRWLRVVHVDGLAELTSLVRWTAVLSSDLHDRGEATVCAWAEVHGGVAILDDADAKAVAGTARLPVHGSLWVVAEAVRAGDLVDVAADGFVRMLVREGARFPSMPDGFCAWARVQGMI